MKTMACHQLGGPASCTHPFHDNTWEEMKTVSQKHAHNMLQKKDKDHLQAMEQMSLMNPEAIQSWMDQKSQEFDQLPAIGQISPSLMKV